MKYRPRSDTPAQKRLLVCAVFCFFLIIKCLLLAFKKAGWTTGELIPVFHLCLQEIDSLIHSNLADIVVELLMTLYEGSGPEGDLRRFVG